MTRIASPLFVLLVPPLGLAPAGAGASPPIDGTRPLSCHAADVASCDDASDTCQ